MSFTCWVPSNGQGRAPGNSRALQILFTLQAEMRRGAGMEGSSPSLPCSHVFVNRLESQAYGLAELIPLFKTGFVSTEVT